MFRRHHKVYGPKLNMRGYREPRMLTAKQWRTEMLQKLRRCSSGWQQLTRLLALMFLLPIAYFCEQGGPRRGRSRW